jgi:oxygen-independent coproporphyrinogen-3 oxidase
MTSVNIDLIYGLPHQTLESFSKTLDEVLELDPDRLSVYNYAHMPTQFKPQRRILAEELPSPDTKLELLKLTISKLTASGYVYIGMDHFAKADDELTHALQKGFLQRNFQGYSTHADCDLVAMGISAIGKVGSCYSQNVKTLEEYYDRLDQDELPIAKGIHLSTDDLLRRYIIQALMCRFEVCLETLQITWLIDFYTYFRNELEQLREFEREGMLILDGKWLVVTAKGRLLIRNICMVFDRYLQQDEVMKNYSRVI